MMHVRTLLALFPCVLFAACGSRTAEFGPPQSLPKEQRPTVWDAPTKARLQVPEMGRARTPENQSDGEKRLAWTGDAPSGWETQPANPPMFRDAAWRVAGNPDTDCYLSASQRLGPVSTNMGRWYGSQFGIQQVPALESLPVVELAGQPGRLAELKGTFHGRDGEKAGWAALIAFASRGDELLMSFKFTGPEAVVAGNKDKFLALAKSLRSATASPDPKAPPIDRDTPTPAGHPPTPGGNQPQPPAASPFTATIPAGWSAKAGSNKPLHHVFGKDGEVYVSQLGGGLKGSLDIWRSEMGEKAPLTDNEFAALPKVAFLGEDAVLLDLSGDLNGMTRQLAGARMLVAARVDGNTVSFCKLVGTAAEVQAQVDAFRTFCGSVRRAK
jgi:hypothetical protein